MAIVEARTTAPGDGNADPRAKGEGRQPVHDTQEGGGNAECDGCAAHGGGIDGGVRRQLGADQAGD
jgi:hypothetical protein